MFGQTWVMRALLAVLFIAFAVGLRLIQPPAANVLAAPSPDAPVAIEPSPLTKPSPSSPESTAAAPSPASTPLVEICGVGKFPSDSPELQTIQTNMQTKAADASRQWQQSMLQSGDLRTRATALLYVSRTQSDWPHSPPTEAQLAPLVHLALGAQDPVVYALAAYACKPQFGTAPGGSCEQITLEDWAALDADNAIPWLAIGNAAHAAKNSSAENAAYAKAASAKRYDAYSWSLYANVEPLIPAGATPLDRSELIRQFVGFETSIPQPPASGHCSGAAMVDPAVRTQCNSLAELMVSRGTTFIDFGVGIAIGERAGWPGDRLKSLREKRDAFVELMWSQPGGLPAKRQNELSCTAIAQINDRIKESSRLGEIAGLEQQLERSGKTTAELAQEYRTHHLPGSDAR